MSIKIKPKNKPVTTQMENKIGPKTRFLENSDGVNLHCSYWNPEEGIQVRGLVYLCHGFAEHLLWYEELALRLTAAGLIAFGHDHIGHGRSDGMRGHVEDAKNYVRDVLQHCDYMRASHPALPFLIVGHSMGGMIAIKSAMTRPDYFSGVVLMGPLIQADPTLATPSKLFLASVVARMLPYVTVAKLKLKDVSSDSEICSRIKKDPIRYHGGIRAHWAMSCHNVLNYFEEHMDDVAWPFLILHGENDKLCSLEGSQIFYKRAKSTDKKLKVFPEARHHLYLEHPDVRKEALQDTLDWIIAHLNPSNKIKS